MASRAALHCTIKFDPLRSLRRQSAAGETHASSEAPEALISLRCESMAISVRSKPNLSAPLGDALHVRKVRLHVSFSTFRRQPRKREAM